MPTVVPCSTCAISVVRDTGVVRRPSRCRAAHRPTGPAVLTRFSSARFRPLSEFDQQYVGERAADIDAEPISSSVLQVGAAGQRSDHGIAADVLRQISSARTGRAGRAQISGVVLARAPAPRSAPCRACGTAAASTFCIGSSPSSGCIDPDDRLPGREMRVGEHVLGPEDPAGRHTAGVQQRPAGRRRSGWSSTRRSGCRVRSWSAPRAECVAYRVVGGQFRSAHHVDEPA